MEYYYQLTLCKDSEESDWLDFEPIATFTFKKSEELKEVLLVNANSLKKNKIAANISRFYIDNKIAVVIEKGYDKGYKVYCFNLRVLEVLSKNESFKLDFFSSRTNTYGGLYNVHLILLDKTIVYIRPWKNLESETEKAIAETENYLQSLVPEYGVEEFSPGTLHRWRRENGWKSYFDSMNYLENLNRSA